MTTAPNVERTGRGSPVTVFAPGGLGTIAEGKRWDIGVGGSRVFFANETIAPWDAAGGVPVKRPRREADRDADELFAVADQYRATRAVGASRGARAIVGLLAEQPDRFERAVLVLPPGGTAAGRYAEYLAGLPTNEPVATDRHAQWMASLAARSPIVVDTPAADVLVIGRRGDQGHPARLARDWADRLAARLELFSTGDLLTDHRARLHDAISEFLGG